MLKKIRMDLNLLESMIYFWQASSENEKVAEDYLAGIANDPQMALVFQEDFDAASVRRVLSAVTNREKLSDLTAAEYQFMHDNMWVMDDMGLTAFMVAPIKVMNLDALADKVNAAAPDFPFEEVTVSFLPGTSQDYVAAGSHLYVNFFRVHADIWDEDNVTIDNMPVADYIYQRIIEMA